MGKECEEHDNNEKIPNITENVNIFDNVQNVSNNLLYYEHIQHNAWAFLRHLTHCYHMNERKLNVCAKGRIIKKSTRACI